MSGRDDSWDLRLASTADADALLAFKEVVFSETEFLLQGREDFSGRIDEEVSLIEAFARHPNSALWIALESGDVIGMCTVIPGSFLRSRHVAQTGIAVRRERWGSGLAQALLEAAIERARERGIKKLSLEVHAVNRRARRLYERRGFSYEGRLRQAALLDGVLSDLLAMGLILK